MLHYEYRFSGSGGQGLMLLGDIMAQAAGCLEGKQILLTKSYGPEARGGACRSEMILSDEPINYPAVTSPDLMLAMSQKACDSYRGDLHEGRILLLDEELVHSVPELAGVASYEFLSPVLLFFRRESPSRQMSPRWVPSPDFAGA